MLTALLASLSLSASDEPSGRYQLDGFSDCAIQLQDSLPSLPEANVEGEAASGFAFASPGCPAGLEALALWRFAYAAETLTLVDGAGETLLTATRQDRIWQGETPDGEALRLTRD